MNLSILSPLIWSLGIYWLFGEPLTRINFSIISFSGIWTLALLLGSVGAIFAYASLKFHVLYRFFVSTGTQIHYWLLLVLHGILLLALSILGDSNNNFNITDLLSGIQQFLTWVLYGLVIFLVGVHSTLNPYFVPKLVQWLRVVFVILIPILLTNPTRSLASEIAVLGAAIHFLEPRSHMKWVWAFFTIFSIGLSGSRMANVAIILALISTYLLNFRMTQPKTWRVVIFSVFVLVIFSAVFIHTPAGTRALALLNAGLAVFDDSPEATILTQGRSAVWPDLFHHALEQPFFGFGPGTASAYAFYLTHNERFAHPHNEYLRIFHDYGAVGLITFIIFYVKLLFNSKLIAVQSPSPFLQRWSRAIWASTVVLLLLFMTDNVGFYVFVMTLHGALIGIFLSHIALLKNKKQDFELIFNKSSLK
ncbi:MAG: hypothetical protein BLITH_1476 [Brockia lithotrophica]|uniref:O-antigen ligase-related domain-containing protein n=1 Tax=Brockia lithotrophica TaxID=933949 RepID=A0A2T5G5D7_9BACL|nr:MAG: hypothetical protein BLITH_1476 [Brockia lithotrophica]